MISLSRYPNIQITGKINKGDFCLIDSRVHGLFACFYCILYGLYISENERLKPIIFLGSDHLYYEKQYGDNLFTYFYKAIYNTEILPKRKITVFHPMPFLHWSRISNAEKYKANLLISKYFNLRPELDDEIMHFYNRNFEDKKVLGVHYRRRDKVTETPVLQFDEYLKKIDYILNNGICDILFLATDELDIRRHAKIIYKERLVLYEHEGTYPCGENASENGLHFITTTPYLHAKDALVECYLLALSSILLSSHKSSMSMFATFFNPELPHITLEP